MLLFFFLVAIERGCPEVLFQPDHRGDESIVYAFAVFYSVQTIQFVPAGWLRVSGLNPSKLEYLMGLQATLQL